MTYKYEEQRQELFTEQGAQMLIAVRDEAKRLLDTAGAFTAERAMRHAHGDSWTALAALDYLVERGEIKRVTKQGDTWGQHQVFTK